MKEITIKQFKNILRQVEDGDNIEIFVDEKPYTFGIHNHRGLTPPSPILPQILLEDIVRIESENDYGLKIYVDGRKEPFNVYISERLNVFDMI